MPDAALEFAAFDRTEIAARRRRLRLRPPGRRDAFSLIEVLIALTIVALALTFASAALLQHAQSARRIAAHEAAIQALDSRLEGLRGGAELDLDGTEIVSLPPETPGEEGEPLVIAEEVVPELPVGLYRVRLTARYRVGGKAYERELESLLWRP